MIQKEYANLSGNAVGSFAMPAGNYVGFGIGPKSFHQWLEVRAGGNWQPFGVGAPVILEMPFTGKPEIRAIRPTFEQIATGELTGEPPTALTAPRSVAHVLGLNCIDEIHYVPKRRLPYHSGEQAYTDSAGDNGAVIVIPSQGRRYGRFFILADEIQAPQVVGVRYGDPNRGIYTADANPIVATDGEGTRDRVFYTAGADDATGVQFAIDIGGTGDVEMPWDDIELHCGDGVANQDFTISAMLWGEA